MDILLVLIGISFIVLILGFALVELGQVMRTDMRRARRPPRLPRRQVKV